MTQWWWWARSSLSESQQPMEVKLEQLLRLQTTEGKRWNIETNLELSLISGPLNSVIAQTLWKSLVDLKCIFWDTAIISLICVLAVTVSQKILYNVMHRERQFSPGNISDCFHHPAETLPSCFPLSFSHPPPSPDQSAVLESSLQQTMACSISSAIGNNCAEYTQTTGLEEHIISEKDEDGGLQQLVSKWDECSGNGVPASGYKCWDQCAEDTAKWWTYCWT